MAQERWFAPARAARAMRGRRGAHPGGRYCRGGDNKSSVGSRPHGRGRPGQGAAGPARRAPGRLVYGARGPVWLRENCATVRVLAQDAAARHGRVPYAEPAGCDGPTGGGGAADAAGGGPRRGVRMRMRRTGPECGRGGATWGTMGDSAGALASRTPEYIIFAVLMPGVTSCQNYLNSSSLVGGRPMLC